MATDLDELPLPGELPAIPDGWRYESLGDLVEERGVSYGIVQPGSEAPSGVPIVRVNNIRNGRIDTTDVLRVDADVEAKFLRSRLQGGEVLLTLVGTLGEVARVPDDLRGWNVARAVGVIPVRQDPGSLWVSICLRSALIQRYIRTWATTTVQATFNLRDLAKLPIPIPPTATREAISGVLGALDDKIEVNRRMNATLEAMARALFQSWFVDFDPVRAKVDGALPGGLDAATASLFPDAFDGDVPRDWKRLALRQVAEIHSGGTPNRGTARFWTGDIPWVTPKGMQAVQVVDTDERVTAHAIGNGTRLAPKGAVLVMVRGMGLHQGVRVSQLRVDAAFNQDVKAMVPTTIDGTILLFALLDAAQSLHGKVHAAGHGTGVLATDHLEQITVVVPPAHVVGTLATKLTALNDRIASNNAENRTLAQLRDTLLPKLLNGELRLSEHEHEFSPTS